jgi:S1-C subfamily serine protease
MNLIDVLVVAGVALAVATGLRSGFVSMVAGTIGTIGGFLVGSAVAAQLTESFDTRGSGALFVASLAIVICVGLGSFVAQLAAVPLRAGLERARLGWVDRAAGGVIAFVAAVAAAWLLGGVLATGPSQSLARSIQESVVLREIDERFPEAPGVVSDLQQALLDHGMPLPFAGFEPQLDPVEPPSTEALGAAQRAAAASTVRISGQGCGGNITGSGVVLAPGIVVTNAHVLAGVDEVTVEAVDGEHDATAVVFDPDVDLAVLRVDGLAAPVLPLAASDATAGDGAAVLGYPGGGPLVVTASVVLDERRAVGRDIWGDGTVRRDVYILQAAVRPGDSGGPFVDETGTVLGVVFARSNVQDDVGYALTRDEVARVLGAVPAGDAAVDTGRCVD